MSSLRKKKGSSGRHHSESDAHAINKHSRDVNDHQSSSVQSSPKYHQRKIQELDSRISPPRKSQSPRIRDNKPTTAYYQDHLSPPQVPNQPSSTMDNAPSPLFCPRSFSPSDYGTVDENAARIATSPGGHPYYSRRSPSGSPGPPNYTYTQPLPSSGHPPDQHDPTASEGGYQRNQMYKRDRYEDYNQPGGYSSLPRQFSNPNVPLLNRGSPAYSSARYQAEQKRKAAPLNRHGSFHVHNDGSNTQLVSPLTQRMPPRDATYHEATPGYGYDYHRKHSLPIASQQSAKSFSPGKSHSGSQLPGVRGSQYPALREHMADGRPHNTQGDFPVGDEYSEERHVFPTFYSQYASSESHYSAIQDYHQQQREASLSHQSQSRSPSVSDSRSRHSSMQPDDGLIHNQPFSDMHDLQGSVEDLLLQEHHMSARTHRRSRSCDASKARREGLVPSPYEEMRSRHQSLIKRRQPAYENVTGGGLIGRELGDAVSKLIYTIIT